jgi:hypothetical protein
LGKPFRRVLRFDGAVEWHRPEAQGVSAGALCGAKHDKDVIPVKN